MAFSDLSTSEKWGIGLLSTAGVLLVGGAVIFAKGRRSRVGLGAPQLLDHRVSPEGMQLKHYYDGKMPIKDRVRLIQNLIEDSVKDPAMRELSLKITNSCPDRDGECETKMIYEWIRNNVRYTGDVAPIKMKNGQVEGIDLFQSARRTVQFKGGDCDDQSILGATLLSLSGIPARLRITKPEGAGPDDWAHIYVMAGLPKTNPKKWVSVDTTLPPYMAKFGKEVPFGKNLDFVA